MTLQNSYRFLDFGKGKPVSGRGVDPRTLTFLHGLGGEALRSDTFKKWLAERGCVFEQTKRGGKHVHGFPNVIVKREDRETELHVEGSTQDLDPREVRRVVDELGLDWQELPGPKSRM